MAEAIKHNDDELDGYEYFHPVNVLGFWLDEHLDRVVRPRFLDPPPNGKALTIEEDEAQYGSIETTDDWKPWSERHELSLKAAEHALEAAIGINRWLRYGLGKRAGKLETELRQSLPDCVSFLESHRDAELLRKETKLFINIIGPVHDANRELCTAAIDLDDGAMEEWGRGTRNPSHRRSFCERCTDPSTPQISTSKSREREIAKAESELAEAGIWHFYFAWPGRLCGLCQELQRTAGANAFFLACRSAAVLLDLDYPLAAKYLRLLVHDRVLTIAVSHTAARATRYLYVPMDGEAA